MTLVTLGMTVEGHRKIISFSCDGSARRRCDGVMLDGGSIRRGFDYPPHTEHFTFGDLRKEMPFDTEMVVVSLKGSVVVEVVHSSRARSYKDLPEDWGGYLQLDDGFHWDEATKQVTHVDHQPLDLDAHYNVAVILLALRGMNRNQPLLDWALEHAEAVPPEDAALRAKDLIVERCALEIVSRLGSFGDLDTDNDGQLTVDEVRVALSRFLKRPVSDIEVCNFMSVIDSDKSGTLSVTAISSVKCCLYPITFLLRSQ